VAPPFATRTSSSGATVLYRASLRRSARILALMQVDADNYSAAASGFSREPAFITRNFDSMVLYQVIHFLF
jgi:hypothetical protein